MGKGEVMSNADYRKHEGISKSALFTIAKSPLHYKWLMDNEQEREDTPALLFGRAVHKYILEREDFGKEFVVAPKVDKRTKEGKAVYEAFVAESSGKDIITEEDFDVIKEMAAVVDSIPFAKRLLTGDHELSFFWTDKETEEPCKCRPDCLTEIKGQKIIVDYKTTDCAETDSFMKSAIKYGYDLQAGMYSEGMKANTGDDYLFIFVAQEKRPPYAVNILQADKMFVREGNDLFHDLLRILHECKITNNWYGYMGENNEISNLTLFGSLLKEYESKAGDEDV